MTRLAKLGYLTLVACAAIMGCGGDDDPQTASNTPAAPTALMVSTLGGAAHLTWVDNATDEESYMVERMTHPDGNWDTLATLPANSTQHHDVQGIKPGTTYMYRVMAHAKTGAESSSAEVTWAAP